MERDHLERPWPTDGSIILKLIYLQDMGCGGMDRMYLVQDRDMWRALVNAVMNLEVA